VFNASFTSISAIRGVNIYSINNILRNKKILVYKANGLFVQKKKKKKKRNIKMYLNIFFKFEK
jgi:hypothetical protein